MSNDTERGLKEAAWEGGPTVTRRPVAELRDWEWASVLSLSIMSVLRPY